MTRKRSQHRAGACEPRIDRDVLRNHDDQSLIDRVWERLDGGLSTNAPPHVARTSLWGRGQPAATGYLHRRARWPLVAAAAAAGFAVGVGLSDTLSDSGDQPPPVVMPADDEGAREVFAAGRSQQRYDLPGGGFIELQPGSIVDTVRQGRDGLTLRLVRGEATLTTGTAEAGLRSTRLALLIGGAEITTAAGSMQVRLDGATADLRVLNGSADVTAPDPDKGMKHTILGPNQRATVPVRVVTASVTSPELGPRAPSLIDEPVEEPTEEVPEEAPTTPAWIAACDQDDYKLAVELLNREPSGPAAALANITNPRLLTCVATGHQENKDSSAAKEILARVVTDYAGDNYASLAARDLERIFRREGNKKRAQQYAELLLLLDEGKVLPESEDELCKQIQSEAAAGNAEAVVTLGEKYRSEYPDGECRENVERLISVAEAQRAQAPPADEPDPYAETGDDETGDADDGAAEDESRDTPD
ncbi:MAG: hypothetical protein DRI90_06945 [Deltaproteobacteria bacterium]|nr:MAG: hypothetical protein DRI90_06945 [Deltaproteobacteria bacterium]